MIERMERSHLIACTNGKDSPEVLKGKDVRQKLAAWLANFHVMRTR